MGKFRRTYIVKKKTVENERIMRLRFFKVVKTIWNMYRVDKLEIRLENDDNN